MLKKLAYTIPEVCEATSASRSFIYAEISAGRLTPTKLGRRTVVHVDDLDAWLRSKRRGNDNTTAT